MLDGIKVKLNGTEFIAPPLALGALKKLLPRITTLNQVGGLPSAEDIDTMVVIVHSALLRNYPDITQQEVEDGLDMGNMRGTVFAVMSGSGLVSGNAEAATVTESFSTSDGSTGN